MIWVITSCRTDFLLRSNPAQNESITDVLYFYFFTIVTLNALLIRLIYDFGSREDEPVLMCSIKETQFRLGQSRLVVPLDDSLNNIWDIHYNTSHNDFR